MRKIVYGQQEACNQWLELFDYLIQETFMTTEYPLLDEMKQLKIPLTRENYIALDTWGYRRSHGTWTPMSMGNLKVRYHQNFGDKFL